MFDWIADIIMWFVDWVPRFYTVAPTNKAVFITRGTRCKIKKPGMHFYWPVWTDVQDLAVVRQTLNLNTQTVTTADDIPVIASAVVTYEIKNVAAAVLRQWDLEDTLADTAQGAVYSYLSSHVFEECKTAGDKIAPLIRDVLAKYGIKVLDARLTDFAETKVISMQGTNIGYTESEDV